MEAWRRKANAGYMSPLPVVQAYAQLGRTEEALSRLEEDVRGGESYLWAHYQEPYFDPIRDHPRFVVALERFHLPTTQSWRRPALRSRPMREGAKERRHPRVESARLQRSAQP